MLSQLGSFLKSKIFLTNFVLAIVAVLAFLFSINAILKQLTHHGQNITVPDLHGLRVDKIGKFLDERNLRYKVIDSLYETNKIPGTILEQDPKAGSNVKEKRTIYLTVNAVQPPKIKMPNLVDVSYRQAEAILQTFGLKVGKQIYKPDLAKNAVLDQYYNNRPIKPGTEIFKGSSIDLVLGDGLGNTSVSIPDLSGLTREEAIFVLKGSSLKLGNVTYDEGHDNANAKIYRQIPSAVESDMVSQGTAVDIFLR